jgi:hypothetical protein
MLLSQWKEESKHAWTWSLRALSSENLAIGGTSRQTNIFRIMSFLRLILKFVKTISLWLLSVTLTIGYLCYYSLPILLCRVHFDLLFFSFVCYVSNWWVDVPLICQIKGDITRDSFWFLLFLFFSFKCFLWFFVLSRYF